MTVWTYTNKNYEFQVFRCIHFWLVIDFFFLYFEEIQNLTDIELTTKTKWIQIKQLWNIQNSEPHVLAPYHIPSIPRLFNMVHYQYTKFYLNPLNTPLIHTGTTMAQAETLTLTIQPTAGKIHHLQMHRNCFPSTIVI